jgi:hypothetical protein
VSAAWYTTSTTHMSLHGARACVRACVRARALQGPAAWEAPAREGSGEGRSEGRGTENKSMLKASPSSYLRLVNDRDPVTQSFDSAPPGGASFAASSRHEVAPGDTPRVRSR